MCVLGTDALASASFWGEAKASLPRAKMLNLMEMMGHTPNISILRKQIK